MAIGTKDTGSMERHGNGLAHFADLAAKAEGPLALDYAECLLAALKEGAPDALLDAIASSAKPDESRDDVLSRAARLVQGWKDGHNVDALKDAAESVPLGCEAHIVPIACAFADGELARGDIEAVAKAAREESPDNFSYLPGALAALGVGAPAEVAVLMCEPNLCVAQFDDQDQVFKAWQDGLPMEQVAFVAKECAWGQGDAVRHALREGVAFEDVKRFAGWTKDGDNPDIGQELALLESGVPADDVERICRSSGSHDAVRAAVDARLGGTHPSEAAKTTAPGTEGPKIAPSEKFGGEQSKGKKEATRPSFAARVKAAMTAAGRKEDEKTPSAGKARDAER